MRGGFYLVLEENERADVVDRPVRYEGDETSHPETGEPRGLRAFQSLELVEVVTIMGGGGQIFAVCYEDIKCYGPRILAAAIGGRPRQKALPRLRRFLALEDGGYGPLP